MVGSYGHVQLYLKENDVHVGEDAGLTHMHFRTLHTKPKQ